MERTKESKFSVESFIEGVASLSRIDGQLPTPENKLGRECYSFSAQEDAVFDFAESKTTEILKHLPNNAYKIEKDPIGNLYITIYGKDKSKQIATGSHLDSTKKGGNYDGVLGVGAAFNYLKKLAQSQNKPKYNYTVCIFRGEESSPHTGISCLGSLIATGKITQETLENISYQTEHKTIPFFQEFSERYGQESWQKVLNSLQNPRFTPENTLSFWELHIEQSTVIQSKNKDIGIIVNGIGGSRREEVKIPINQEDIEMLDTSSGDWVEANIEINGEAGHTGGTPHNEHFSMQEPQAHKYKRYRKDALVSASILVSEIIQHLLPSFPEVYLKETAVPEKTGFTTIPKRQIVRLILPKKEQKQFQTQLSKIIGDLSQSQGTQIKLSVLPVKNQQEEVIRWKKASNILNFPQFVSQLGTISFRESRTETGKIRLTVTDFQLSNDKESGFKIDYREVDTKAIQKAISHIHKKLEEILGNKFEQYLTIKSEKPHAPLNLQLSELSQKTAKKQNISFVLFPSMPGQDAASFAYSGIPTGMFFVKHDGKSHRADENVNMKDYKKAETVYQRVLDQLLIDN